MMTNRFFKNFVTNGFSFTRDRRLLSTIRLSDINVEVSGRILYYIPELIFGSESRLTIVGKNGAGKSMLAGLLSGSIEPSYGSVLFSDRSSVGYLPQEPITSGIIDPNQYLLPFLLGANASLKCLAQRAVDLRLGLTEDEVEYNQDLKMIFKDINIRGGYSLSKIMASLKISQLPFHYTVSQISPGELTRVMLSKLFFDRPKMIILDEPTNHLDKESVSWLEQKLKTYPGGVALVTHDRVLLEGITREVAEINNESCTLSFFRGRYSEFLKRRANREKELWAKYQRNKKTSSELTKKLTVLSQKSHGKPKKRNDNDKIGANFKAQRNEKNVGRRVTGILKKINDISEEYYDTKEAIKSNSWVFSKPIIPTATIEINNLSINYYNKTLIKSFSSVISNGEKIVITGSNGCGKSTLLKVIAGVLTPTKGDVLYSGDCCIGYLPQTQFEMLDDNSTPVELISEYFNISEQRAINKILKIGLISLELCHNAIFEMSIGEQRRFLLTQLILEKPDILLLDEPTNHLDLLTAEYFEKQLFQFEGIVIAVSHDRKFIKNFENIWHLKKGEISESKVNNHSFKKLL